MSTPESQDPDIKLVEAAVNRLCEHFDTVQVFVTRYESSDDGTTYVTLGNGNWFARSGVVREWLLKEEEATRLRIRDSHDDEDDD